MSMDIVMSSFDGKCLGKNYKLTNKCRCLDFELFYLDFILCELIFHQTYCKGCKRAEYSEKYESYTST